MHEHHRELLRELAAVGLKPRLRRTPGGHVSAPPLAETDRGTVMTVFDKAVLDLTWAAQLMAKDDIKFRAASFETFTFRLWPDDPKRNRYGLPHDVFKCALAQAYTNYRS